MANGGRPKGSHDIAPQIRGAFKRAALRLENKGKGLSVMIEESLENDFLNTLKAVSHFVPKEMVADITTRSVRDARDLTDEELDQLAMVADSLIDGQGETEEEGSQDQLH